MNEVSQLASAMLATAFAAVMLVVGQLYIENKSARPAAVPAALTASPWDPRTYSTEGRRHESAAKHRSYVTFRFSADSLPLCGTMSNVTIAPSTSELKPAFDRRDMDGDILAAASG
jgi:hypothetical protein